jgi:glucose/arabinose dehydrogenase
MTGDLFMGDVGDSMWEEIDVQPHGSHGGENYGWPIVEGVGHCHTPMTGCTPPTGAVMPVYETAHDVVTYAIMGGDVYRGSVLPSCYAGRYFFGDYGGGWVRTFLWSASGGVTDVQEHVELTDGLMSSLGMDGMGELYILALDGRIDRIVPAP